MAVNPSALTAIREGSDLTPAIQNLQLAFKQGVLDANEINDALSVGPSRRDLARESNISQLQLLPLQTQAARLQLEQDIAQAPARAELGELQLQSSLQQAQAGLDIFDSVAQKNKLEVESQLSEFEGLLGAQPFANPQNAAAFFQRTRPGESVPKNPQVLEQKNQEAFNAIQRFKTDMKRFSGAPSVETFTRVDPETFNKERVRVTFDGAGNVVDEQNLGLVEMGEKSLTEQQANAVQYSARMRQAQANLTAIEDAGFDPAGIVNHLGQWASRNKLGGLASSSAQQYEAAKRNWIAAVLRKESGAAIAQSEYKGADHQYFPQPRDTAATIAQKSRLRETALKTMQAAGLFGLPPAQKRIVEEQYAGEVGPSAGPIVSNHEVISDSEYFERYGVQPGVNPGAGPTKPSGKGGERKPISTSARVEPDARLSTQESVSPDVQIVGTREEVLQLPPNVKFFTDPSGVLRRNPNYRPGAGGTNGR